MVITMRPRPPLEVQILRNATVMMYPFTDYFKGFEKVEAVRRLFGDATEEVLAKLRVEFVGRRGYMGVSNDDGHLNISAEYLRNGAVIDLYLDVIHELVHVKQFMEGKELFDRRYNYVDRPTEIEAYRHAVQEARKLGMSIREIMEYLKTDWISDESLNRLARALNLTVGEPDPRV
jgi:hypothetical protein